MSSNSNGFDWFDIDDHTPNDSNGRMLIVNADFTAGEFYSTNIAGLCENTSYEFSAWMVNLLPITSLCPNGGIPINVRFEIWDNTNTNLLARGDTGNINGTSSPNWEQYALVFQTLPGQTSVILKMLNNGSGGCGNDLAIDDIVFKSCGDTVVIEDASSMTSVFLCEDELPFGTTLTAMPDFSIFSTHFYQWQESSDGLIWADIPGETSDTYVALSISNTTFYRVKLAEDAINVNNNSCNSFSEVFEIRAVPIPNAPISNGIVMACEDEMPTLSVSVPNGVNVNWYDAPTAGNLLLSNSPTFSPATEGIFYAEAEAQAKGCISVSRTPVELDFFEKPVVFDESLAFCKNTTILLEANPLNPSSVVSYLWDNGNTSQNIRVSTPGTYSVVLTNGPCSVTKTIVLSQIDNPIIASVESDGSNIVVTTSNTGDFLYSLDGSNFQSGHIFANYEGGPYTIYVKHRNCDAQTSTQFIHFYIPKYFTPNGDTVNDTFDLKGIEFFNSSKVSIFDRHGKLLKSSRNTGFSWNGTFAGQPLPSNDYWYVIVIEGQKFTGHFSLKR